MGLEGSTATGRYCDEIVEWKGVKEMKAMETNPKKNPDLISRKAAKDELTRLAVCASDRQTRTFARCVNTIELLPSVEAEPVRHGRWCEKSRDEYPYMHYWDCSACGCSSGFNPACPSYKYCPDCGAKMDAQEVEEREKA